MNEPAASCPRPAPASLPKCGARLSPEAICSALLEAATDAALPTWLRWAALEEMTAALRLAAPVDLPIASHRVAVALVDAGLPPIGVPALAAEGAEVFDPIPDNDRLRE